MKKIDLGQTITLLANLGVIAGIAFLGYELRQNNLYQQEIARNAVLQNRVEDALLKAMDSESARIWYWRESDAPLSELDARRRADFLHTTFLRWQHDYQSIQIGMLDRDDVSIPGIRSLWRNTHGIDEVWERRKTAYSPNFVEWMEENVVNVNE